MQKIKIVHFVEELGKGGLENVVLHIVSNLDRQLFEPFVICRIRGGYTARKIKALGIPLEIINQAKVPVLKMKKTLSAFKGGGTSILHCHGLFATSTEALIGRMAGYRATFVHVHNLEKPETFYEKLKLWLLKRNVSQFIAVSNDVGRTLKECHLENVTVIDNGIDTEIFRFHPVRTGGRFDLPPDSFILGMVGRIVKRKGFKEFVQVIEALPNICGVIVGEGDYEDAVQTLIKAKNLSGRIEILPFHPQEKLPDTYSGLDALFLYSEKEGLPLALLEAQSVGVPYIGNSIGGIGEVVKDGYNGFILSRFDVKQIKCKISKLIDEPSYYRKNSRKAVEDKYSLDNMIKSIEKLYIESLN